MPKKVYYIVERVLGEFNVDVGELQKEQFFLKYNEQVIEIHYRFESDLSSEEVMEESIGSRINLPELIDLILAKGSKKRSWDIRLFREDNGISSQVGYSRAQISGFGSSSKSLFRKNVGIEVLGKILESQLANKSKLSNSIISALRQARNANYIEMKLIWSWYALEWYIQSKSELDNLRGILDYPQDGSEKYRTTVKKILKSEVEGFLDSLDKIIIDSDKKDRLESDIQEIKRRLSANIFSSPILSFFNELSDHFEEVLKNIESILTDSESIEFYKNLRDQWTIFQADTKMVKNARDKFSHLSLKAGTLGNIRDIDSLNKVLKFMINILALMVAALTQNPEAYDGEAEILSLSELKYKEENLSYRPILKADDEVVVEDWKGDFVTEGKIVKEEDGFIHIEIKNPSVFLESSEKDQVTQITKSDMTHHNISAPLNQWICHFNRNQNHSHAHLRYRNGLQTK